MIGLLNESVAIMDELLFTTAPRSMRRPIIDELSGFTSMMKNTIKPVVSTPTVNSSAQEKKHKKPSLGL